MIKSFWCCETVLPEETTAAKVTGQTQFKKTQEEGIRDGCAISRDVKVNLPVKVFHCI